MTLATDFILATDEIPRTAIESAPANGEGRLLLPLVRWLIRSRRINAGTQMEVELPWFGRRIDLATLTTTRRAVAYELKLSGLGRALEQAAYNRLAFDRSYVVTASTPRAENIALADEHGIGIVVVRDERLDCLLESPLQPPMPELRRRLLSKFAALQRASNV